MYTRFVPQYGALEAPENHQGQVPPSIPATRPYAPPLEQQQQQQLHQQQSILPASNTFASLSAMPIGHVDFGLPTGIPVGGSAGSGSVGAGNLNDDAMQEGSGACEQI